MEENLPAYGKLPAGISTKYYRKQTNGRICCDHTEHPKIVFSRTLHQVEWKNAKLAKGGIQEEVSDLRQSRSGRNKYILAGSPGLIVSLMKLNLIDEYQLCVHPVIAGSGLPLFRNINNSIHLKLLKTKTFGSGAITLYYDYAMK